MNRESNHSWSTGTSAAEFTPLEFALEEMGKKDRRWRLVIRPADLALYEAEGSQPFVILREQLQGDVVLMEGMGALVVNKPKKATFKLPPEAVEALAGWIGASALAAFYLKRRYAWVLPMAVLWIIGSLPVPGHPESGAEAVPLDVVGLGLGVLLLVSWAFAKWRPHPVLFLVDSIWFLCLAGYLIREVLNGRSKLWMILVGLLLWLVITGVKHFARFRGVTIKPATRGHVRPCNPR